MNTRPVTRFALFISIGLILGQQAMAASDPKQPASAHKSSMQTGLSTFSGKLTETMDINGYTYLQLATDDGKVWAAGPLSSVKKGDQISFNGRMPMTNFHSKSLKRDFETIYFVDSFTINGKSSQSASLDPHKDFNKAKPLAALKSFDKAKNGQTIAEVLENKTELTNKRVNIRGQVSKFTAGVMGKNWIHIRDSSSQKDLTVTTDGSAALDDIILLEGQLALNKDFGYGYTYEVIIEDAKIRVE